MLILPAHLTIDREEVPTYALTDTGAEGKAFVDEEWARTKEMPLLPLKKEAIRRGGDRWENL